MHNNLCLRLFTYSLAAFWFLPITIEPVFSQSNDRCSQALSHEAILKRVRDIPKVRIENLTSDINRLKVSYKMTREELQQIASEIEKLDIDSSVKMKISTDLFLDINTNFVGENCLTSLAPEPRSDTPSMATKTTVDRPAQEAGKPIPAEIANDISINMTWLLNTGYLVMFMAAGFALVAAGFTQAKNVTHTVTMVLMVYVMGTLGWWICGFAFMFGGIKSLGTLGISSVLDTEFTVGDKAWGLIGLKGFFLSGATYDVGVFGLFLFQKFFMDTANYIPTGAMAERWKYLSLMIYALFMSMLLYPLFGNWVWGGGWLSQLGTHWA